MKDAQQISDDSQDSGKRANSYLLWMMGAVTAAIIFGMAASANYPGVQRAFEIRTMSGAANPVSIPMTTSPTDNLAMPLDSTRVGDKVIIMDTSASTRTLNTDIAADKCMKLETPRGWKTQFRLVLNQTSRGFEGTRICDMVRIRR